MKDATIKEKTFLAIGAILLIAIIGFGIAYYAHAFRFQNPIVFLPEAQNPIDGTREPVAQYEYSNGAINSLQEVSGGTATDAVSYENALQLYKGRIMQFNPNCRASPVIMNIPAKSVVMLDNRSKWQRNLIVGPRMYTIAPYDYVLASFNIAGEQFGVTCDSVQNVSIISVQ
jgi:hypothetical protein